MCAKISVLKIEARRLARVKFEYSCSFYGNNIYSVLEYYTKMFLQILHAKFHVLFLDMRQILSNLESETTYVVK